jgi:hypothetical protein
MLQARAEKRLAKPADTTFKFTPAKSTALLCAVGWTDTHSRWWTPALFID